MVFGEVSSKASVNYEQIVRQAIKTVGYDDLKKGMDYKYFGLQGYIRVFGYYKLTFSGILCYYDHIVLLLIIRNCTIIVNLDTQSPEINQCLKTNEQVENLGAGDQGLMIGYATNETEEAMPLTHLLSHNLCRRLRELYEKKIVDWIQPDHKTQVRTSKLFNGR